MDPTCLSLIPGDIMQQVFGRLPFPELVRLRVVCKRWNAMICSLYFTPHHVSKCVPVHFLNDELTVYNSRLERWEKHSLSFFQDHIQTTFLEFVASAGGLLCFETDTFGQLIVCNPISKLWKVLQIPSKVGEEDLDFMLTPKSRAREVWRDFSGAGVVEMRKRKTITGLLVDSATGNYQIIVAALDGASCGRATFLYDSLAGSWKRGAQVLDGEEFSDGDAILCNGSFYCLVTTETKNGELFRYNVRKDKWSKLSLEMSVMRCKLVEHRGQVLLVKRNSYYSDESTLRFFQLRENYRSSMTLEETDLVDRLNLDAVSVGKVLGHLKSTGRGSVMGQKNFLYVLKPPYEDGSRKKRTRVTIIDLSTGACDVLREMIVASTDASTAPRKTLIKNVFHLFSASVTVQV